MNDRFKYRAWYCDKDDENDSDNNKMFYNAQDTYDCLGGNPPLGASSFGDIIDDECWVVEQCTGIKDKNGKLIYEGDIVDLDDSETYAVIKWGEEDGCWRIITCENTIYTFDNLYGYELTICGDIHENADLLENNNDNR